MLSWTELLCWVFGFWITGIFQGCVITFVIIDKQYGLIAFPIFMFLYGIWGIMLLRGDIRQHEDYAATQAIQNYRTTATNANNNNIITATTPLLNIHNGP